MADASLLRAHVTKRFGGLAALDAVSLTIGAGEVRGLIGPNGAGKTTLVNVLSGVLRPTAGSISFAGNEIAGSPPYRIARLGIRRTFQTLRIFPELSVLENVAVGYHAHTAEGEIRPRDHGQAEEVEAELGVEDERAELERRDPHHPERRRSRAWPPLARCPGAGGSVPA